MPLFHVFVSDVHLVVDDCRDSFEDWEATVHAERPEREE